MVGLVVPLPKAVELEVARQRLFKKALVFVIQGAFELCVGQEGLSEFRGPPQASLAGGAAGIGGGATPMVGYELVEQSLWWSKLVVDDIGAKRNIGMAVQRPNPTAHGGGFWRLVGLTL